jgi:hypothetical protein
MTTNINSLFGWRRVGAAGFMLTATAWMGPALAAQPVALDASQSGLARIAPDTPSGLLTLALDARATMVSVDIGALPGSLVTSITGPAGQLLTAATVASFGGSFLRFDGSSAARGPGLYSFGGAATHQLYQFPSLGAGVYTVRFEASGLSEQAAVIVAMRSDSSIGTRLFFTDGHGVVGRPIVLAAALMDGGLPLAGASVKVHLLDDHGAVNTLTLHDDGIEADGVAGDGLYSALFTPSAPGRHVALAELRGSAADGTAYLRNTTTQLDVVSPNASFTGRFSSDVTDTDGNGRFERIVLFADVDVLVPGTYRAQAQLRTVSGKPFSAELDQPLAGGAQQVRVGIEAAQLQALKESGPYNVERVDLLLIDHGAAVAADTLIEPGATASYRLDQLERLPIALIGTSDDFGADTNGNGLYDQLTILLDVDLDVAGFYQYSARLTDGAGRAIDLIAGGATLAAGRKALPFVASGSKIGLHGVNGPYRLDNVLIFGAGAALTVLPLAARTRPYTYRQFESSARNIGDINNDGQVDCADLALLKTGFGKRRGQTGFDPRTDVNFDNVTDARDLALVSRALPIGVRCP